MPEPSTKEVSSSVSAATRRVDVPSRRSVEEYGAECDAIMPPVPAQSSEARPEARTCPMARRS